MLPVPEMIFSHKLIEFCDDWDVRARQRAGFLASVETRPPFGGGGIGWPRLARCRAGDRHTVAWAKSRSQRLGGGASNFAGNRFQVSPGARGGSAPEERPFCERLRCWKSPCQSRLAWLPAVGKQAGRAFRFRMSPLPMHRVRWRERSLTALLPPNDVRLRETQMRKCAIYLHETQHKLPVPLQASVFHAKRPPDHSDGRLQNPPLGENCDQLAATCPPARRSAAARRSTSASAAVRASATHFSSTMSRP